MKRKPSEIAALIAASLMRKSGGVKQVCLDIGVGWKNTANIRKYIDAFRDEGCVYISGWTNQRFPVYSWQPSLFHFPDAHQPAIKNTPPKSRRPTRPAPISLGPIRLGPNSVFAMGAL